MSGPRVSVIVAARNAEDAMPELLERLAAQTLPRERVEVILVDDSSRDRTAELAEAAGFVKVLRSESWGGAYMARNIGLEACTGDVIAITDADCKPDPRWLENALDDLDTLGADLIGGHVEVPLSDRPTVTELVDFARYLDQRRALEEGGFAATANLVFRRDVYESIGAFNPRVISGGDREFCRRAVDAGFELVYSRRAMVRHFPRRRPMGLARRAFRDGVGRAQMVRYGWGFAKQLPRIWARPGAWFPSALAGRSEVYGIERVYAAGYTPSQLRLVRMRLAEYLLVQLPTVAGNIAGSLREGARR